MNTTYVYVNPNTLDGDPFQVAEAAFKQADEVGRLYGKAINDAYNMARIAEMEREIQRGEEPNGSMFVETPLGSKLSDVSSMTNRTRKSLKAVGVAAAYNPRNPPKEA